MTDAEKELDDLYLQGLGLLTDAMHGMVEGTHGGDAAKRDAAIGARQRLLLLRLQRLHEAYRAFAREAAKKASGIQK